MNEGRRTIYVCLFISLAIAFIVQVVGIALLDPIDEGSKEYLSISGSLFNGEGYAVTNASFKGFESFKGEVPTRMRQPGYPFYLVLFYWLLGENIIALQISQIVLNVLTLYFVFLIAYNTFRQRLWPGTLIGLGLYFPLWLTSAFVLNESLFTFLLVLFMFLFQKAIYTEKIAYFALSGAVLSSAFLTRPIVMPLYLLSFFPIWYHVKLRKAAVFWGLLLIASLAVIFPWFLRNAIVLGDYTPLSTDGRHGFWVATLKNEEPEWFSSPQFRFAVRDEDYYMTRESASRFVNLAIENIKADPSDYFVRSVKRVIWTWSYFPGSQIYLNNAIVFGLFRLIQIIVLLSAAYGMLITLDMKTGAYYLLPVIVLSCALVFHWGFARIIIPAMPFVLVLSGQGFWLLGQRLMRFKIASSQRNRDRQFHLK